MIAAQTLFLVATLCTWVGIAFFGRLLVIGVRALTAPPGPARADLSHSAVVSAIVAAVTLLAGAALPKDLGREAPTGMWLPLVWVYTPIGGWMALVGAGAVLVCAVQWYVAPKTEKVRLVQRCAVWAALGGLGLAWLSRTKGEVSVLRGAVPVSPGPVLAFVALAVLAVFTMVCVERKTRTKGRLAKFATHLALMAGSLLFGLPFFWMLSTSFKEERDLANTNGIQWIPLVQATTEYRDPERPVYSARFEGRWVLATKDSTLQGGNLLMEVDRPYGIRGRRFEAEPGTVQEISQQRQVWKAQLQGRDVTAFTAEELDSGNKVLQVLTPEALKGETFEASQEQIEPVRSPGARWQNYIEAVEWMPFETVYGLRYLANTLWMVVMSVIGTVLSCSLAAYGFSRLRFPGKEQLFGVMLATMMLPAAVTMLPQFLLFRSLGWVDSLLPLWVPTFFGSAFHIFMLRQFFSTVPVELEEAARIDGCSYLNTYWQVMLPQVRPALAVIAIWVFMGAWNNFMGPLIYVNSPEKVPLAYALQLFAGDRSTDVHFVMAFSTMTVVPVVLLFFVAQKYFIEGVTLSGFGGR